MHTDKVCTRYNVYSRYLINKFGQKIYKIPINLPVSCPNRDGVLGYGGCIFCDETGSGFSPLADTVPVAEQIRQGKELFRKRFKAQKFIAYFQSFTNTYLPLSQFEAYMRSAAEDEDVVGIAISTRPDCISDAYLNILVQTQKEYQIDINIELGLQTVNYHTLLKINRGHTLAEFIDAVLRIRNCSLDICAHIILNLPWDSLQDVIECAKFISALGIHSVKIHSLYIAQGTKLGEMYENGELTLITFDQYISRVIAFLEYLDPSIVVQRLVGKGPQDTVLFCNWDISWWKVKHAIESSLETMDSRQGIRFDYLNGRAVKHFI